MNQFFQHIQRFLILVSITTATQGAPVKTHLLNSPDSILLKVDEIRNPSADYEMRVLVKSGDNFQDEKSFSVFLSGNHKTLIKTIEPARDHGRNLLMLNEEMWAYVPNLKRTIRVGLSQRLSGQTANGDISRMRWSGDYSPTVESQNQFEWILLLKAKKKGLTYDQIRVWVEKKSYRPLRSLFLTVSGLPLKKATYRQYRTLVGRERPSQIEIQDATKSSDKSLIVIEKMNVRSFPEATFRQSSLSD